MELLKGRDTGGIRRGWTHRVGLVRTALLMAIGVAATNLRQLLLWVWETGDTRDQLVEVDVTAYGFADYDADGNLPLSELWRTGETLLGCLYEEPPPGLPPRNELDIIAVSQSQEDVFAVWRGGQLTDGAHPVIWFASELVESQDNVYEWLGAVIQYTERRLDRLRSAAERP